MKKQKKIVVGVLATVIILAGVYFYKSYKRTHTLITNDKGLQSFMMNMKDGDLAKYKAYKDKMYAQDNYGGSTPEETLGLFIDALKKGDVKLASKYFVLEKQDEQYKNLKVGKNNGVLKFLIKDLEKDKKGIKMGINKYRFRTYTKKGVAEFSYDLILNKQTGKWKILDL